MRKFDFPDLIEVFENSLGLGLVDSGNREADVDEHVVADLRFGSVGQVDFFHDASELDASHAKIRIFALKFEDFSGDG